VMHTTPPVPKHHGKTDLGHSLSNRRWIWRAKPFPHLTARDVFIDSVYGEFEEAFRHELSKDQSRFARNMKGYDASGRVLESGYRGPFEIFLSRAWHDLIADIFQANVTGDVVVSLHHHEPGSKSGRPHNDLNPGWFIDRPRPDGINVADMPACNYEHGRTLDGSKARATVRAIAVLFYLANPPWSPGDGGETGLYWSGCDPVERPVATVAPINNSMLCFPCTPYSYHSFIHNVRHPRNSLTMWLHAPKEDAVARWGEHTIVYW
jgi:hypothetical protein